MVEFDQSRLGAASLCTVLYIASITPPTSVQVPSHIDLVRCDNSLFLARLLPLQHLCLQAVDLYAHFASCSYGVAFRKQHERNHSQQSTCKSSEI